MKKKDYLKPSLEVVKIDCLRILAGSETLGIGGSGGDSDIPESQIFTDGLDVEGLLGLPVLPF